MASVKWLRWPVVAFSFAIYAVSVLSLRQADSIPFLIEEEGPLPVVLSHWIYGLPLGVIDSGLVDYFRTGIEFRSTTAAVQGAFDRALPKMQRKEVTDDGTGIGGFVTENLAFFIFGPQARSLPKFFLLLLGISTLCFAVRYRDARIVAVPILLTGLTILLMTVLSTADAEQTPIGGIRYAVVLGILPGLHWCLELLDEDSTSRLWPVGRWLPLVVQMTILGLAIIVRGTPLYFLAAIVIAAVCGYRRRRGSRMIRDQAFRYVACAFIPLALLVCYATFAFPQYAHTGRTYGIVWHRAFISFGIHPKWPFAGLRERYECSSEIPEGLGPSSNDRNGHCVWWAHQNALGAAPGDTASKVYDGDYEAAMRSAFFDVLWHYPRESLATFFYFKPKKMWESIVSVASFDWDSPTTKRVLPFVGLQIAVLVIFISAWAMPLGSLIRHSPLVLLLFLLCAMLPQLAAWSIPTTMPDIFTYIFCAVAVAVVTLTVGVLRCFAGRRSSGWAKS